MEFLTDFADLAVVLPMAACVAAAFAAAQWWRGLAVWSFAVAFTLAIILVLKLVFLGCAAPAALVFSPSGHTAAGTLVYGGTASLWLRRRFGLGPVCIWLALPVALIIGLSRLALHKHSVPEVLLGGLVGLGGVAGLVLGAFTPPLRVRFAWALVAAVPLLAVLHGSRLPAEAALRSLAGWLPRTVCAPFSDERHADRLLWRGELGKKAVLF